MDEQIRFFSTWSQEIWIYTQSAYKAFLQEDEHDVAERLYTTNGVLLLLSILLATAAALWGWNNCRRIRSTNGRLGGGIFVKQGQRDLLKRRRTVRPSTHFVDILRFASERPEDAWLSSGGPTVDSNASASWHATGRMMEMAGEQQQEQIDPALFRQCTFTRFYTHAGPISGKVTNELVAFAPRIFATIRAWHRVDLSEDVAKTFGDRQQSFKGDGKSNSDFMMSSDSRFIFKSLSLAEVKVLLNMLPTYYAYIAKHVEASMLCRILGLFKVRRLGGSMSSSGDDDRRKRSRGASSFSMTSNRGDADSSSSESPSTTTTFEPEEKYFILMLNISRPLRGQTLSSLFDLKGSLSSRIVKNVGGGREEKRANDAAVKEGTLRRAKKKIVCLKDQNWLQNKACVDLPASVSKRILSQLKSDADFLKQHGIMDYSLLLSVYETNSIGKSSRRCCSSVFSCCRAHRFTNSTSLDVGICVEKGRSGRYLYAFGIIDILQAYNSWKSAENRIKSLVSFSNVSHLFKGCETSYSTKWVRNRNSSFSLTSQLHSAIDPKGYSERFVDFMRDHVFHRPMCHAYRRSCCDAVKKGDAGRSNGTTKQEGRDSNSG